MDPIGMGLGLLYLYNQGQKGDQDLHAFAVPSTGWLVIRLPWDVDIVIGNTYAFNTNRAKYYFKRYGDDSETSTARDQYLQFLARTLRPMPTTEPAKARWLAAGRVIAAKWRNFVWALDERDNIATVDKGHFLGKCLQGTQATCSSMITTILQAAPGSLEPLSSSTVGRCHRRAHF